MLIGHQPKPFLLALEDLTVSFDGFKAVNDLSFYVDKNEIRVIIGPNGAGKTTVLDLICGKTKATSGSIKFRGKEMTKLKENQIVQAGVGRKFQTPSIYDDLTVFENLEISFPRGRTVFGALTFTRDATVRDRVHEVADMIFLKDRLDMSADLLSHGQKQWLEIGMLLIQDPELLMLDEPVAGMSVCERAKTAELLNQIIKDRSVIVIEHDMKFVENIAHQVTVLHQGKMLSEGTMETVKNDPKVKKSISVTKGARRCWQCGSSRRLRPERGAARPRRLGRARRDRRDHGPQRHGQDDADEVADGHRADQKRFGEHGRRRAEHAAELRARRQGPRLCAAGPHDLLDHDGEGEHRDRSRGVRRPEVPEEIYDLFPVLLEMKDRRGGNLSGGQQQQLAIARALASEPKVLLLDEPTEGIQPSIIKDMARTLKRIRDVRGLSIVVCEQVLSFALDIADRMLVIENGEIVRDDPRDSVDAAQVSQFLSV